MPSCLTAPEVIANWLDVVCKGVDTLLTNTNRSSALQVHLTNSTVAGPAKTTTRLPTRDEIKSVVMGVPGTADEDYTTPAVALTARKNYIKSVGKLVKDSCVKGAEIISDAINADFVIPADEINSANIESIQAIKKALVSLQNELNNMTGANMNVRRLAAITQFDQQIAQIAESYGKINHLQSKMKGIDQDAADINNQDDIDFDELQDVQNKRSQIDKEISRANAQIVQRLLNGTIITAASLREEERYGSRPKAFYLPTPLEGKGREFQNSAHTYVISKGKAASLLIPAVIRMLTDFDPITGLWWSWSDLSNPEDDYSAVPDCFSEPMKAQNRELFADIKTAIMKSSVHKGLWPHMMALHTLGGAHKKYQVREHDGLGLIWMITMLYRPSDEKYRDQLEQETYALCRKLSSNSKSNPRKFLDELRELIMNCGELGVHLKWLLTGSLVVANMSGRNNIFAQKLAAWLDGSAIVDRENSSTDLQQVVAVLEDGCNTLESIGGEASRAYSASVVDRDDKECRFGDDCYAKDCKHGHSSKHDNKAAWKREEARRASNPKGGKGKGKTGKSGGKGGKGGKQRCKQPGCHAHQLKEYCNSCYRKYKENTDKPSRSEKRAATAKKATKAADKEDRATMQNIIKAARAQGASSERHKKKRERARDSSDDDEPKIFARMGGGAPKSVKAARKTKRSGENAWRNDDNVGTGSCMADLMLADGDEPFSDDGW